MQKILVGNTQHRDQNEVKSDCPISEIKKGISEVICAKFHDFFTIIYNIR